MKKKIDLKVQVTSFPIDMGLPDGATQKIFIPCWGEDFVHHYFLVDFESKNVISYEVNLKEHLKDFKEAILTIHDEQIKPYNMSANQLLFWITCPHQGEYYDGKIIVSMNYCNCFICIDVINSEAFLITDLTSSSQHVYSSTNELYKGKMFTSRWDFKAMYKTDPTKEFSIPVEIISYDINNDSFTLIDTIQGHDQIHSTSVTNDGQNIVLVEQNATPCESKAIMNEANEEELSKIQKSGLVGSKCWIYNIEKREYTSMDIHGSPAHVAFDENDDKLLYFSQHQLGVNQGQLYSFSSANILKFKLDTNGTLIKIGTFSNEEAIRLPGHVVFDYKGEELIITPSTPNQIILINRKDMSLFQNIKLSNSIQSIDFNRGPYLHVPMSLDKTPYSVHAKSNEPYLYLSNASTVGLYDLEQNQRVVNFRYAGDKVVLGGGHSTRFAEIKSSDLYSTEKI